MPDLPFASLRISDELRSAFLNPSTHIETLSRLIGIALAGADPASALALADRRCRLSPPAGARDHLLRAEAAQRAGDPATAETAMRRACELDPTDAAVNVGAMTLLRGEEAHVAAQRLVATGTAQPAALSVAIGLLAASGRRVVGSLFTCGPQLRGFVAWPADEALTLGLRCAGLATTVAVRPDRGHPLVAPGRAAAALSLIRPGPGPVSATFDSLAGRYEILIPALPGYRPSLPNGGRAERSPVDLTVIVPVYEDAEGTSACLDSLARQATPGCRRRTIVVDDHSPNPRLVADLGKRAARGEITLLSLPENLGFAAAVNAAAALTTTGDLLLLNADTLLPPGSLDRLRRASLPVGVGTVVPLSNHGEVTSFPRAHLANDLPSAEDLAAWDRAAQAHGGEPRDIPTGTGFCLLVTRPCWDALGGLSDAFGRGYYEDVDLCLRARERGYRNLCAPSVVVGHAGSRSFRSTKRALVVANEATLLARHPSFPHDYAAFLRAAPLRPAMARIERALTPHPHPVLLLTSQAGESSLLAYRREFLSQLGRDCLIGTVIAGDGGARVSLRSGTERIPQSITFDPTLEASSLTRYLMDAKVERVELLDPELARGVLRACLAKLGCPIDIHLSRPGGPDCLSGVAPGHRVLCSDAMAAAYAGARSPAGNPVLPLPAGQRPATRGLLAALSPVACAGSYRLLMALARQAPPETALRILGATLDDLRLMANGPVFATGPVAPGDFAEVVARLAPSALLLPYRAGSFFILESARAAHACRSAYFDWSGGAHDRMPGDLALDPALGDEEAAERIVGWWSGDAGADGIAA